MIFVKIIFTLFTILEVLLIALIATLILYLISKTIEIWRNIWK